MAHPYKPLFDQINASRKEKGLATLTWKQFWQKKDPALAKKYRQGFKDVIEPDPAKTIQRPPAVYSNQSVYDKYGL